MGWLWVLYHNADVMLFTVWRQSKSKLSPDTSHKFLQYWQNESTTWTPGEIGLLWTRSTRSFSSKLVTLRELKTPLSASLKDALLELHPCFCRTTKFSCQQWNTAVPSKVYQKFLACERVTKNKVERSKSTWHGFHATKYLWDCRESPKITPWR